MRVVYKNKYKAIRKLWKKVDLCYGISRLVAFSTILLTLAAGVQLGWVEALMVFSAGAMSWGMYAIAVHGKLNGWLERIQYLQDREDDAVSDVDIALYPLTEDGKYTLGVRVNGQVHQVVKKQADVPVLIDCLTDKAMLSNGIASVICDRRTN